MKGKIDWEFVSHLHLTIALEIVGITFSHWKPSTFLPQQTKCIITTQLTSTSIHNNFFIWTCKIFTLSSSYLNSLKLVSTSGHLTKSACFYIFSCEYFVNVSQSILLGAHFLQDIPIRFAAVTNGVVIVVIVLNILSAMCK